MDTLITLAQMVAAVVVGLTVAAVTLTSEFYTRNTEVIDFAAVVGALFLLYKFRLRVWDFFAVTPHRLIRGFKPWFWWPFQRAFHRWRRRSYLTGGIMAKWHAMTVLSVIDDALLKAAADGKLSSKQYKDVMRVLGLLFGAERFVPRPIKMHPEERKAMVRENIASVKAGPVKPIPGPPELTENKPKVIKLDFLRNRGRAA